MLKAVAPVLFALAALATPNDVTPTSDSGLTDQTRCHRVFVATAPVGPEQIVTICPSPS